MDEIKELSAALDEIFRLRRALAYEADTLKHHLALKTFPKSRRDIAEQQIERMEESARGNATSAYITFSSETLCDAMERAEASPTLTRSEFARELPYLDRD
jgi:hypothetical protein